MRKRITFLPEFTDITSFRDTLARAAFHLAHTEPEVLTFVVSPDLLDSARSELTNIKLPDDFDQDIKARLEKDSGYIEILDADSPACNRLADLSDVIVVWDQERFNNSPWVVERPRRTSGITIFDVDKHASRNEGSTYAVLSAILLPSSEGEERRKLGRMLDSLGARQDVYLFGSGPSVSEALDQDFTSGVKIVCNSVILDRELMDHIDPQIVTFADPIFHFGPSIYAAEFRTALRRTLAQHPSLWAVIPSRYQPLMESLMPELASRIIGVPFMPQDAPLNLNLRELFGVKPYPNILTLFMLPLAATIGVRVGLIGFDGREPSEDYFWKHGDTVQIHEHLPAIQRVHPGFFVIDYDDYYGAHVATVEYVFRSCEAQRIVIEGLGKSLMPPLKSRRNVTEYSEPTWIVPGDVRQHHGEVIVTIDPDWVDDFGHYGPWFRSLADECQQKGIPAVSLASRGMAHNAPDSVLATFSYPTSWAHNAIMYAHQFDRELREAVARILNHAPHAKLSLFFYTANVWHLRSIISLCAQHPTRLSAVVNLMRAHEELLEAARSAVGTENPWVTATSRLLELASEVGVTVAVDTEEQAQLVMDLCEIRTPVLPMATTTRNRAFTGHSRSDSLLLYCPAQSQQAKGIFEFTHAARSLLSGPMSNHLSFRMRSVLQPTVTDRRIVAEIEKAATAGVEVLTGPLSDEDYASAVQDADIIVLPYRADLFRTRTSGSVVDAILSGKPVVVASGTWAASILDSIGTGVMFRSGDREDLARAMLEAVNRYDALAERAVEAAVQMTDNFAMSKLVDFILDSQRSEVYLTDESIDGRLRDAEAMLMARSEGIHRGAQSKRSVITRLQQRQMLLVLANDGVVSRNELLEHAIRDRDNRFQQLVLVHKKVLEDGDALHKAQIVALERDNDVLRGGLGNRIFGAIKRRISN